MDSTCKSWTKLLDSACKSRKAVSESTKQVQSQLSTDLGRISSPCHSIDEVGLVGVTAKHKRKWQVEVRGARKVKGP